MDDARQQLLAGPRLAVDHDARVGRGDALGERHDLADPRRVADGPIAEPARFGDLAAQTAHLAQHATVAERALHARAQFVARGRLAQIIERALAHRVDRALDGGVAGEHDERNVDVALARPLHQLDPGRPRRHVQVGEHDVVGDLVERRQRRLCGRHLVDHVIAAEQRLHQLGEARLVVDDQKPAHGCTCRVHPEPRIDPRAVPASLTFAR